MTTTIRQEKQLPLIVKTQTKICILHSRAIIIHLCEVPCSLYISCTPSDALLLMTSFPTVCHIKR